MKTLVSLPMRRSAELGIFNPALPLDGSLVVADVLRDQFNGLAAMIAAITSVTAAQIDGVQTLLPGEQAFVTLTVTDETLHFTFGIPRGDEGVQGQNGADGGAGPQGEPGSQGEPGAQGPPFAQAVVDGVTTLNPGEPATVSVSFDGTLVHFSYGIPSGYKGADGTDGGEGPPGPPFAQAVVDSVNTLPPGEPATVGVSFDGSNVHFVFSIPEG
ncbi:MAG: hypothetical protein ABL974_01000, partial [Prosthecobacter sp.]